MRSDKETSSQAQVDTSTLERQLQEAQISKKNAESSKIELEQQISAIKGQLVNKENELNDKEAQLSRKISELKSKEEELKALSLKVDELSNLPPDVKEGALIDSLRNDLKRKTEETTAKDDALKQLEEEISSVKYDLEKKSNEVCTKESEIKKLESEISSISLDLKKKTEELEEKEEEIEDLEDEVLSTKKKLNSAKTELAELTEKIEASDKKVKSLERDLRDTESELSDLKDEDKVKSEAIEFVNAVLEAKDADDRDAKTINEQVSKIESIIFDQYIPLQRQYFGKGQNIDDWINQVYAITFHWTNLQRKSWLKRKKVIAFIGEFSAGKTSIVNRILSQDDPKCPRLPVSGKVTTAIATYISYGEGFNSQFTDANGDLKNLPTEMFTKVNKNILSKVNVSSIIQYFVMKYKNENLRGLSILDTPGFSSNDDQDKDRTLAVINEADALFWVLDANSGEINRTSRKIIADNVNDIPLYVVINKADTKSPSELDGLEKHIRETMSRDGINVSGYVRFSQKAPLKNIMTMIEGLPDARTGLDIGRICLDLQRDLYHLQKYLDDLKKDQRDFKKLLENREEILNKDIDKVIESCGRISEIPQYNSRFFSKDDYRMDQDEYAELVSRCEGAVGASEQVKECFEDYKDFINQFHEISNEQNDRKEQYAATKNIHNLLMNAIKNLDAKLYQEIEIAVKEALEEDKKEDGAAASSSGSQTNRTNQNSAQSSQESIEELKKADHFYNMGKIEEAKFWYKRAAQHGNEQAIRMCNQLGFSY